jgi:fumarate reductase subunit C
MRDTLRLFIIIGKAALIVTAGCFVLEVLIGFLPQLTTAEEATLGALMVLSSNGAAVWWASRKLRTVYSRREARALSVAFGVVTPVSLLVALAVSPMFGYSELVLGGSFVLVGVFVGIVALTALLTFFVCVLVLRVTRLAISVEQGNQP